MKRGKPQVTITLNHQQMREVMNLADTTGSLSSAGCQFLDRGIGEMKNARNITRIPKFLHVKTKEMP